MTGEKQVIKTGVIISTHTPHTRHDGTIPGSVPTNDVFLLTRLIRGMTKISWNWQETLQISTHTPHTRHDRKIYEHFTITPQHIGGQTEK